MTKKKLAAAVDALGALRDRIHGLKKKEEAQTKALKAHLAKQKKCDRTAKGNRYVAEFIPGKGKGLEIVDMPRFKKAAGRKFLGCVKVDLGSARKVLGADKVDALGVAKNLADQLKIYKSQPGGKAPRKANGRAKK